jgi:hypothetical protein
MYGTSDWQVLPSVMTTIELPFWNCPLAQTWPVKVLNVVLSYVLHHHAANSQSTKMSKKRYQKISYIL